MTRKGRKQGRVEGGPNFAVGLVGLSLDNAERLAAKAGYVISVRDGTGWFMSDFNPRRMIVSVRDGVIVSASVG